VNDELERLVALDTIDRAIEKHRAERARRLAEATAAHAAVEKARAARAEAQVALDANRVEERAEQRHLEELRAKRASALRVLTTGAGNPEAAQRQLDTCDALIDQVETRMLEVLERQDGIVAAVEAAAQALERATSAARSVDDTVPKMVGELDAAIADLDAQRPPLLADLHREVRNRYDSFRVRGRHAVAHFRGGACEECSMEVHAQHLADLKRGRLEPCRGCHRWLAL
jgi:predicted  nucleic acid-binding Zn-ribbon protein